MNNKDTAKKQYQKEYRERNKEKIKEQKKLYYQKNRIEILEKKKLKRRSVGIQAPKKATQPIQKTKHEWYIKNKKEILEHYKNVRKTTKAKEFQKEYQKKYRDKKRFEKKLNLILTKKLEEIEINKKKELIKLEDLQIFITDTALSIIVDDLGLFIC
jgi:hypothetical protein